MLTTRPLRDGTARAGSRGRRDIQLPTMVHELYVACIDQTAQFLRSGAGVGWKIERNFCWLCGMRMPFKLV